MKKLKILITCLILGIFPCLIYYTEKFYSNGKISFNSSYIIGWTIVMILVIISLILNCFVLFKMNDMGNQIKELREKEEEHYYSSLEHMNNTREIIIDCSLKGEN